MHTEKVKQLLTDVRSGKRTVKEALEALKGLPFEDIGDAMVDHHRQFRRGFPEVIMGEGKAADQIISIVQSLVDKEENVLITRIEEEKVIPLREVFPTSTTALDLERQPW